MLDAVRLTVAATAVLLALLPRTAFADSYYCTTHGVQPGEPSWLCAGTSTGGKAGWEQMVSQPDAAAAFPVSAASSGSNGGVFAASASASASAAPGLLRLQAIASAFGNGEADANGAAQAQMFEEGTFAPLGGTAPGTPIGARVTLDAAGAFSPPAAADGDLDIFHGNTVIAHREIFLSSIDGDLFAEIDLPGIGVGDSIYMVLSIRAFASASDVGVTSSSADVGDTVRLFVDVTSGNATFEAASGHDYTTVPEPGAALLALVGAAVLAGARARVTARAGRSPSTPPSCPRSSSPAPCPGRAP